jgi:hypothetical protein
MIGAVSEFGKLGLTVIGNDTEEVEALYERAIEVLDTEGRAGRVPSGYSWQAPVPVPASD